MIVVSWHRFGPYHHARLRAAARKLPITGLELSDVDSVNAWERITQCDGFSKITLCTGHNADDKSPIALRKSLDSTLEHIKPKAVAVHGWSARSALILILSALDHNIPIIMMSDSTLTDSSRNWFNEKIKRAIVRKCAASLVAGKPQSRYINFLGMPKARVFLGYNAIDNSHFSKPDSRGIYLSNNDRSLGHGSKFFLTVGRFVGHGSDANVKNHFFLFDAYKRYLSSSPDGWNLVIIGDGDLRSRMERHVEKLGLRAKIFFPGYKHYDELPCWYSSASAFVLPSLKETWGLVVNEAMAAGLPVLVSNRCGCAPDLVRDGVNGFTFDPTDVDGLARLMHTVAHGGVDLAAMGRNSAAIIADWGPERFASGLADAVAAALREPRQRPSLADRLLLRALAWR